MTVPAAVTSDQLARVSLTSLPANPANWSLQEIQGVLGEATPEWIKTARRFVVDGDHWQEGSAWIGPQIGPGEDGAIETLQLLKAGFTSRNVLAEMTRRYTNGLVGFEPNFQLVPMRALAEDDTPTPAEQQLIDEAYAALTDWWDRFGIASRFWAATYQMAWGMRSPMRLYLSDRAFVTAASADGVAARRIPRQASLADALALVLLDVPSSESACVFVDPNTQDEVGIYVFTTRDGKTHAELCFRDFASKRTIIRTLADSGDNATRGVDISADLAQHLPIHEMIRTRLLSDAAFQLQRALNLALSVIPRTIVTAGFLERILINAKLPGKWATSSTGAKTWQPSPVQFGAGTTLDLQGEKTTDEVSGKTTQATPSVQYRDPVPVTGSIEARRDLYAALLEECAQAHVLLAQEQTPSGISRREARADYVASLMEGKHAVDRAGRWLVGAVLALAEHIMATPGRYTKALRVNFACRVNPGPLSIDERTQNVVEWEKGLRSRESVMLEAGISDTVAEIAQLMSEPAAQLDLAQRQADAMQAWLDVGISARVAGKLIGLDDALLAEIERDLFPTDLVREPPPPPEPSRDVESEV